MRGDLRSNLEEFMVRVDGMGIMVGGIMVVVFMCVMGLFEVRDRVDDGIVEVIVELGMLCIKVWDNFNFLF